MGRGRLKPQEVPLQQVIAPLALPAQRLDQLERPARLRQKLRLQEAFGIFGVLLRVGNNTPANPHFAAPARQHGRADRHVELAFTGGRDRANGARVDTARLLLHFADKLHGPDLGRPGDGPAREQGTEHVGQLHVRAQFGSDARRHLVNRAIGLDGEEVRHLHRPDPRHPREIVAQEIDDHEIFRTLLFVHGEPSLEARILARRAPSRGRALHGTCGELLALTPEKQLGREREHGDIRRFDQCAIGNQLPAPQGRIERDRVALEVEQIFLREVDLVDVARRDVVLNGSEGAAVFLAAPG